MTDTVEHVEELDFNLARDPSWKSVQAITARGMAARLPRLVVRSLGMAWRADRASVAGLLACQTASGVVQALGLLATTGTITAIIGHGDIGHRLWAAWPSLAVLAGASGVRALFGVVISWLSSRLGPVMAQEAELMMMTAAVNVELAAYDSPGFSDRKEAAEMGVQIGQDIIQEGQDFIAACASLAAGAAVLTAVHPVLLPLLLLAAFPQGIAQVQSAKASYLANLEMIGHRRMLALLRWHTTDKYTADQIRSATMAPFLLDRARRITDRVRDAQRRAFARGARMSLLGSVGGGMALVVVWSAVVWLLASGRVSVALAGTAVFALRSANASVQGLVSVGARMFRTGMYLDDWTKFLDEAGGYQMRRGQVAPKDPQEIRVTGLVYQYEGAKRNALDNVDLTIRRGEVLALVGENGSGKTTLTKLLTGLYLPTGGAVEWDGIDIREMDPVMLWRRIAMVPQEFAHWPLSARENVTQGQGQDAPGAEAALWAALEASGADEVVNRLRSGLRTLLAREWVGGEELSGGQWQRIALARAFYRPAGLLVLDEPTSALDPRAEHRIFTGLRQLATSRAVVLVTHRLTNVTVANRIVVLDQGRIVQSGTFAQLSTQPGLFRELWELQNDRSNDTR
ncbi:ATP-binding cassette domain-containing protein [Streptantibioticus rubrisoli]|uniref:ABC transporter ATP-binding protein/permease n=1 Tax=Streptantibioticus rubrisoli TaxID=1387313 RepID=A0ABT1P544_9ACTN|nr:ABC transporter ATP-binding protein [Streptantibioticus rubrisoli]MCQ4040479.1 ABC transporter ATP-binding protein/permease [Streptantibioticus rubrisoli]